MHPLPFPARRTGFSRIAWWALLVALAGAALSCAERIKIIDPALSPPNYPEGTPSTAQLMVWPDTPTKFFLYKEGASPGPRGPNNQAEPTNPPPPPDTLLDSFEVYQYGPGILQGLIYDDTPARHYQVFRRESSGGFRALTDFLLRPVHPVLDSVMNRSDLLHFVDRTPFPVERQYIGRGVIGDVVTESSPLTNLARTARDSVSRTLKVLQFRLGRFNPDTSAAEGVSIDWEAVPGAVGYWIQIYQGIVTTQAAPLDIGQTTDYLVAYVPSAPAGGVETFDIISPAAGVKVLVAKRMIFGLDYIVRISAISADGELIACTGLSEQPYDWGVQQFEDTFLVFSWGGAFLRLTKPRPPPSGPVAHSARALAGAQPRALGLEIRPGLRPLPSHIRRRIGR